MSKARYIMSLLLYLLAAIIFLGQTLFGCFAVLGIGFDTLRAVLVDLSLTMSYPIFLLALWNRKVALSLLWIFFVAQWIDFCSVGVPPKLMSPLSDWHGQTLFLANILFTVGVVFDKRSRFSLIPDVSR